MLIGYLPFLVAIVSMSISAATAGEVVVAVAANFTEPAKEIAALFKAHTGHRVAFSFGATGQLYTQITQEAPFDVLLSADRERPAKVVEQGYGVPDSVFTYAVGKLVLWTREPGLEAGEATLRAGRFNHLAVANPRLAPYGAAAAQVLNRLGLAEALAAKLVEGANIAQTFQFVDTGNAEFGFVAWSQVITRMEGSHWLIPDRLYDPIRQDAVLLTKGADNPAARTFLEFLRGPEAKAVILKSGYDLNW
ncbi:Molybdate-binding protein ModA [uncultured Gammaproteobacteria bacterium]